MGKLCILLLSALFFGLLTSCSEDDLCTQTVTYNKATGEYAQLELFRSNDINSAERELVNPGKIFVSENMLLIGEQEKGIHVIDNSDPTNPIFVNFLAIPGNREMAIRGTTIFADSYYDMIQIDISDARSAVVTNRIEEAFPVNLRNSNGEALINFKVELVTEELSCNTSVRDNTTEFIDFDGQRLPESAIPTSFVSNGGDNFGTVNRMAITDDHLYAIGDHDLHIFNELDDNFKSVDFKPWFGNQMETIYPFNDLLFIGSTNAMSIYRLSNPTSPDLVGNFWHATSCDPVLPISNSVAFVTLRSGEECPGDENTLNVLDISRNSNPVLTQSIGLTSPYAMTIHNGLLYVGEGPNGFRTYEINGTRVSEVDYNNSITAYDIIPHPFDKDVLLFAGPSGISQYQQDGLNLSLISVINY